MAKKDNFGMLSVKAGIDKNPNPTHWCPSSDFKIYFSVFVINKVLCYEEVLRRINFLIISF